MDSIDLNLLLLLLIFLWICVNVATVTFLKVEKSIQRYSPTRKLVYIVASLFWDFVVFLIWSGWQVAFTEALFVSVFTLSFVILS